MMRIPRHLHADPLQRELAEAKAEIEKAAVQPVAASLAPQLAAAEQRCAELERDAQRYRWLCSEGSIISDGPDGMGYESIAIHCCINELGKNRYRQKNDVDRLNAAIDAALKEGRE